MADSTALHFFEKKGPIGAEKRYAYSEIVNGFIPIKEKETSGKVANVADSLKGWIREAFLPQGYPDSVSADYLHYQFWDSAQAYCSNIAGALSLQATLSGLGVGDSSATSMAATLTWLLKDGFGMVSSIAFACYKGGQLDCNSKQWRLFADVVNDLSHFLKLVAPLLPIPFMGVMCFSAVMLSLVGVAGGATRSAFSYHQARRDNMAEVSAKDGSQETMVNLAALITNITILPFITSSQLCTWITFLLCVFLHLLTNYLAVRAIKMESLNRPRLLYILESWFFRASIPDVQETNLAEPLYFGPAFDADYFVYNFKLSLGVSLHEALQRSKQNEDLKIYTSLALEALSTDHFCVVDDLRRKRLWVVYGRDITYQQELEAFFTAYLIVLNYVTLRENVTVSAEYIAPGVSKSTTEQEIVPAVRLHAKKMFPFFLNNLETTDWCTNKLLFAAREWRIQ